MQTCGKEALPLASCLLPPWHEGIKGPARWSPELKGRGIATRCAVYNKRSPAVPQNPISRAPWSFETHAAKDRSLLRRYWTVQVLDRTVRSIQTTHWGLHACAAPNI